MASLTNRPRDWSSRLRRTYRLEMGGKSLLLLLGLASLTGLVLFYMGVITGMGMREPVAAQRPMDSAAREKLVAALRTNPASLAFNQSLFSDQPVVEDLIRTQEQAARDTANILARAQRELSVEQVPIVSPAGRQPDISPPAPNPSASGLVRKTASAPKPSSAPTSNRREVAESELLFTVQVFSSQSEANARALLKKLSRQGFSPYLNRFQDADRKTWYRVRVGKTTRYEAERLETELRNRANLKNPRIIQL